MNQSLLETFLRISKLRTFTPAVEKADTVQSGGPVRIADPARERGTQPVQRATRDVRLTTEGWVPLVCVP